MQYADDPKRVFNWLVRDAFPMCEIERRILEDFFSSRWSKGYDINENQDFKLENTMNDDMKQRYLSELLDLDKMKATLRTPGNLSAQDWMV